MKKIFGFLFLIGTALVCAEGQPDYEKVAETAFQAGKYPVIAVLIAEGKIKKRMWLGKMVMADHSIAYQTISYPFWEEEASPEAVCYNYEQLALDALAEGSYRQIAVLLIDEKLESEIWLDRMDAIGRDACQEVGVSVLRDQKKCEAIKDFNSFLDDCLKERIKFSYDKS